MGESKGEGVGAWVVVEGEGHLKEGTIKIRIVTGSTFFIFSIEPGLGILP